jgi:predicted DNA-binding protein with PD1-like motif
MASRVTSEFPRPRTLIHPGAFNPVRIRSRHCEGARHVRLALQPGLTLFDALVLPLAAMGIENASTTILGGFFDELQFCVAPPDPSGHAVIAYTVPRSAGRCTMVFGNATIGKDAQGRPLVHCHAAIRSADGDTRGGHIITQASIVGPEPIAVLVTSLEGFELRVAFDPETNIPLMQPSAQELQ